jgi:hypothetical protein
LDKTAKEIVPQSLVLAIIEVDRHLYQIISTQVAKNKIYGSGIEIRKLAPYIFGSIAGSSSSNGIMTSSDTK